MLTAEGANAVFTEGLVTGARFPELPEASQNLHTWEMTEVQRELTALSCYLRPYGIEIRFVRDEIPGLGLRVLKRVNQMISVMDQHAVDSALSTDDTPDSLA